ncbi:hypothetical protein AB1K70_03360 [Bremerella sp. JC770]|uniref:hypothetical protein n=1 Tax=Bremerella sp. JC770 TaxID=3232137 RepID=UPI003459A662
MSLSNSLVPIDFTDANTFDKGLAQIREKLDDDAKIAFKKIGEQFYAFDDNKRQAKGNCFEYANSKAADAMIRIFGARANPLKEALNWNILHRLFKRTMSKLDFLEAAEKLVDNQKLLEIGAMQELSTYANPHSPSVSSKSSNTVSNAYRSTQSHKHHSMRTMTLVDLPSSQVESEINQIHLCDQVIQDNNHRQPNGNGKVASGRQCTDISSFEFPLSPTLSEKPNATFPDASPTLECDDIRAVLEEVTARSTRQDARHQATGAMASLIRHPLSTKRSIPLLMTEASNILSAYQRNADTHIHTRSSRAHLQERLLHPTIRLDYTNDNPVVNFEHDISSKGPLSRPLQMLVNENLPLILRTIATDENPKALPYLQTIRGLYALEIFYRRQGLRETSATCRQLRIVLSSFYKKVHDCIPTRQDFPLDKLIEAMELDARQDAENTHKTMKDFGPFPDEQLASQLNIPLVCITTLNEIRLAYIQGSNSAAH